MQQTFVLHTQKNTSFVLHTQKKALKQTFVLHIQKSTSFVLRTQKSTQKIGKKRQKKKTAKKLAKNMPKKYIAIFTTHMANHQKKQFLKHNLELSCCCLETGLKPVLLNRDKIRMKKFTIQARANCCYDS
jgi:hypothetical protein